MQRIGFDRIDFPLRPTACNQLPGDAESKPADERHEERHQGIESKQCREARARLEVEQQTMQQIHARTHDGHDHARDRANKRRQRDQTRLPRAHNGAQAPRYLQLAGSFVDQGGSPKTTGQASLNWAISA